jgi:hypothetical protein
VIVGLSNDNEIIIQAGLEVNDQVLLVPPEKADDLDINVLPQEIIQKFKEKPALVQPKKNGARDKDNEPPAAGTVAKP